MADRGRDLKVSILSDVDRFDAEKPAEQLEKLGKEALDAQRDLDKLWDEANKGTLDKLGDDADSTAKKVDSAFEKIAASSKSNLRKVDDDLDRAKRGMDDFKDEAGQSGREAAASFGGEFEDIGDFIQETAANAFGGFGALGAAAGVAAAAGIGFITKSITEAREKFEELRKAFTAGLIEGGGDLKGSAVLDKLREMAEDGSIETFADQARKAKVPVEDYLLALAGDIPALERTREALFKYDTTVGNADPTFRAGVATAEAMHGELNRVEGAYRLADGAAQTYADTTKGLAGDEADMARATDLATEALSRHEEANNAVAESIRNAGDASAEITEAVEKDGQVALDTITKILAEQNKAAANHTKNLKKALDDGGEEFAAFMAQQPAEVAQAYVDASPAERKKYRAEARKNMEASADGLIEGKATVTDAAGNVFIATKNALTGETIVIPVEAGEPGAEKVANIKARIIAQFGTLQIPVNPTPNRQSVHGFFEYNP